MRRLTAGIIGDASSGEEEGDHKTHLGARRPIA
jgi:hypothetical protein